MADLTQEEKSRLVRRLKSLEEERKRGWESHWRELSANFLPRRARFLDSGDPINEDKRNGAHLLERMADRYLGGDPAKAVFLDSALSYAGGAVSSVSGFSHLNGMTVALWGDGEYLGEAVVSGGRVTLPKACSAIVAGLRYTTDIETMPVEIASQNGVPLEKTSTP